jgi:hypothetical protein
MTDRDFCFWLKGVLDANPTPNSTQIRKMLDRVNRTTTWEVFAPFVAELKRVLEPVFGAESEISAKSVPGLIHALNNVVSEVDSEIPRTACEVKRGFVRPGE